MAGRGEPYDIFAAVPPFSSYMLPSMRGNITFAELLATLGGAKLSFQRQDDVELASLAVAVFALPSGRQVIAIERTYRDGIRVVIDPTPEELEIARNGDLWRLWNSERSALLMSIV
jgi:hypothetical protein